MEMTSATPNSQFKQSFLASLSPPAFAPVMPLTRTLQQPQQGTKKLNTLFKTQLCKHYVQSGNCVKGDSCHFAHGDAELRRKDEELPLEVRYKMLNIPYNNYKTRMCKYFEMEHFCHFGKNCTYAHGIEELRHPYQQLPSKELDNLMKINPNAFRLLNSQIEAFNLQIIQNNVTEPTVDEQILESQQRNSEKAQGPEMLQKTLDSNQISPQPQQLLLIQPQLFKAKSCAEIQYNLFSTPVTQTTNRFQQFGTLSNKYTAQSPAQNQSVYHTSMINNINSDLNQNSQDRTNQFQNYPQVQVPIQPPKSSVFAGNSWQYLQSSQLQEIPSASLMYTPIHGESSIADCPVWGSPTQRKHDLSKMALLQRQSFNALIN